MSRFKLLHDVHGARQNYAGTVPDCFLVECNFSVKLEYPKRRVTATTCLLDFLAIENAFQKVPRPAGEYA